MKKNKLIKIIGVFSISLLFVSCGTRGSLETAPPMFGKAKIEYKKEQAKKAEIEKTKQENKSN